MYIVVWTVRHDPRIGPDQDHWTACETMEEAEAEYQHLVREDIVYTASICGVIKSTDYAPQLCLLTPL